MESAGGDDESRAPLALLIDDGWAAAATWDARLRTADDIIARAENDSRAVALIPLSDADPRHLVRARRRRRACALQQIKPKPHTVDRTEVLPAIARFLAATRAMSKWSGSSDGIDLGRGTDFVKSLGAGARQRPLTIVAGGLAARARAHRRRQCRRRAQREGAALGNAAPTETGIVRALDLKGLPLGEAPFAFKAATARPKRGSTCRSKSATTLRGSRSPASAPPARCSCSTSAGGAAPSASSPARPPTPRSRCWPRATICQRALGPFADVRLAQGAVAGGSGDAFSRPEPADAHPRRRRQRRRRCARPARRAGSRTAACWCVSPARGSRASDDDLVPVKLRRGGRILGGSLSWDKPQPLAAFAHDSPFNGMKVPNDVTVSRQVLAEPDAGLTENTWATLADGTPLVTAAAPRQGRDRAVPCHRRYALVGSAAVGRLRRDAQAHRRARGHHRVAEAARRRRRRPRAKRSRRAACSTASELSCRRPRRHGRCRRTYPAAPPPSTRRAFTARRKTARREYARRRRPPRAPRFHPARQRHAAKSIASASRRICAGRSSSPRSRSSRSTR